MRVRCALFGLLVALSACGSSSADSSTSTTSTSTSTTSTTSATMPARPKVACGPARARTLASSSVARVYAMSGIVYGCSSRGKASIRLGQVRTCLGSPRVAPVAVAGGLAAYGLERCGVDTGTGSVQVQRLSDGKVLHAAPATVALLGPESYRSVAAVVVRPDGAVAWIGTGVSIIRHSQDVEVHKLDRDGSRTLDRGAGIDARSLRLRGSRITWRHGGRTLSAMLR